MHTNSINYMNIFNCRIIPAIIIIIISKRLKRERERKLQSFLNYSNNVWHNNIDRWLKKKK